MKGCPFCKVQCGHKGSVHVVNLGKAALLFSVVCDDCDFRGPSRGTEELAIESWDRFVGDPKERLAELELLAEAVGNSPAANLPRKVLEAFYKTKKADEMIQAANMDKAYEGKKQP